MSGLASNTIAATIGGLLVAVFSYFVLVPRDVTPSVELQIHRVNVPKEFAARQIDMAKALTAALLAEASGKTFEEELEGLDLSVDWLNFTFDFPLGTGGSIEELEIVNNEDELSAEISVEGRDTQFALLSSKSVGIELIEGNFSREVRLLPQETMTVLHFSGFQFSQFGFDSRHIYISQSGRYLSPSNAPTLLDEMFGPFMKRFPFIVFILMVFGFLAILMLTFTLAVSSRTRWRVSYAIANTSDYEWGIHNYLLSEIREHSPEKAKRIDQLTERLAGELMADENKQA